MARNLIFILLLALLGSIASASSFEENRGIRRLKWPNRTVKVFVSSSLYSALGAIKAESDVNGALLRAFQRWEEAVNIEFQPSLSELSPISPPGPVGDGISIITVAGESENLSAFSRKPQNASGLTRVFFDQRGSITEADIVLNPSQLFSTDGTPGTYDLESVLTHELGHLLGLQHAADASSVMFDGVPRNGFGEGSGGSRSLSADDRAKIRNLYGFDDGEGITRFFIRGKASPSRNYIAWIQDARSGALVEATSWSAGKQFEFTGVGSGTYEVLLQDQSSQAGMSAAISCGVKTVRANMNVAPSGGHRPLLFDIRYIGLNGHLAKRGIAVGAGTEYRLDLAGPGIAQQGLRFGATAKGITLETIDSEVPIYQDDLPVKVFRMFVAASVAPGQYSIFAEDSSGSRRYFVGAINVT